MIYIYPIPAQLKRYPPITIPAMMFLEDSLDIIPQVIITIVEVQSTKVVIECCFGRNGNGKEDEPLDLVHFSPDKGAGAQPQRTVLWNPGFG